MTPGEFTCAWEGHLESIGARPFGGHMTRDDLETLEAYLKASGQI